MKGLLLLAKSQWDRRPHCGSVIIGKYLEAASQFVNAFAHTSQSDSQFCSLAIYVAQNIARDATPVVPDLD